MTVQQLLEKARKNARENAFPYYLDICDGNVEETKEYLKKLEKDGTLAKDIEQWTVDNIFALIKTIRKTSLMTEEEKKQAIKEIHSCKEYQAMERKIAMNFANHFVTCKDTYLR